MAKRTRSNKAAAGSSKAAAQKEQFAAEFEEAEQGAVAPEDADLDESIVLVEPATLQQLRLSQGLGGMLSKASMASGIGILAARDRILQMLMPAEVENSTGLMSLSRFRQLDAVAKWDSAVKPPRSFTAETLASITSLPSVRRVACTSNLRNFSREEKNKTRHALIVHRPEDDVSADQMITKTALGVYRYESSKQWIAIGNRVAHLLEHIAGDPFTPKTAPVKLRRIVHMVFAEMHPTVCPPDYHVGRPTAHRWVESVSYQ
jgi:hypothetical protein